MKADWEIDSTKGGRMIFVNRLHSPKKLSGISVIFVNPKSSFSRFTQDSNNFGPTL